MSISVESLNQSWTTFIDQQMAMLSMSRVFVLFYKLTISWKRVGWASTNSNYSKHALCSKSITTQDLYWKTKKREDFVFLKRDLYAISENIGVFTFILSNYGGVCVLTTTLNRSSCLLIRNWLNCKLATVILGTTNN